MGFLFGRCRARIPSVIAAVFVAAEHRKRAATLSQNPNPLVEDDPEVDNG
jgi:hypothetical protein